MLVDVLGNIASGDIFKLETRRDKWVYGQDSWVVETTKAIKIEKKHFIDKIPRYFKDSAVIWLGK